MSKIRQQFTRQFELQIIHEIEAGKSLVHALHEHQAPPNMLLKWRQQVQSYGDQAFAGNGHGYIQDAKVA